MKTGLLILALCTAWLARSAQASPLSLKEAVAIAIKNSPSFDSAQKTETVRTLEARNAIAKLLPSLDFTTTDGLQNNVPISSNAGTTTLLTANPASPWYSSLSLGLTETFYDNGASLTQLSIADLTRETARLAALKARDTLTLDIATEFYHYSLTTVLLEVRKQQQSLLERQFKTLSSQYQQGFKTRSDFLRLKTQVQRAEIERVTAENAIQVSVAAIHKLLGTGLHENDPPTFAPITVQNDGKVNTDFPTGPPRLENFYDFQIAQVQQEINGKSVTLARRLYLPRALLNSGVTYTNQNYLNSDTPFASGHQLSWNLLLTLQYNIWDWGSRRRDVQIAQANVDIAADALQQNLLDVRSRIAIVMADLSRIRSNLSLSQELFALEEQSNHDVEIQYREGKVTYLDLITSLNSLLDAKVQFYTSNFEALQILARYKFYEGTVYETIAGK